MDLRPFSADLAPWLIALPLAGALLLLFFNDLLSDLPQSALAWANWLLKVGASL